MAAELTARVKVNMDLSPALVQQITDLREPLGIAQTAAIRHLLVIGINAVKDEHNGSLGAAIEAVSRRDG